MQYRTTSGQAIHSLEELRALIEAHDAWGISLHEFQHRAGYRKEGNAEYITTFSWGYSGTSLQEMWDLVQYIHKYYGGARVNTQEKVERIADPATPAPEVLRLADELFSRGLVYVHSGQKRSDEMVQGILHAVVRTLRAQEQRDLS